jgi:hypothetical protein
MSAHRHSHGLVLLEEIVMGCAAVHHRAVRESVWSQCLRQDGDERHTSIVSIRSGCPHAKGMMERLPLGECLGLRPVLPARLRGSAWKQWPDGGSGRCGDGRTTSPCSKTYTVQPRNLQGREILRIIPTQLGRVLSISLATSACSY